jgi:hypothetical protein
MKSLLIQLLLSLMSVSQAQSPAKVAKPTTAVAAPVNETYMQYLERMDQKASRDLERAQKGLDAEKDKSEGYDPCMANRLAAEIENARWFKEHRADFETPYRNLEESLQRVSHRLNLEPIRVLSRPPQEVREIPVSLQTVVDFIRVFNKRLKSCTPENLPELRRQFDDPGMNSICDANGNKVGVAISQVKDALAQMVMNLNMSLKEQSENYRLDLQTSEARFDLNFVLTLKGPDGAEQKLQVSLLEAVRRADGSIGIPEARKWDVIQRSQVRISGRAIEGRERFLEFIWEKRGLCPNLILMGALRGLAHFRPSGERLNVYEDFTELMAWSESKKYVKSDGIARASIPVEFQAASECVKIAYQVFPGFRGYADYAWLCGESDNSPVKGKGVKADHVEWLAQALGVGIRDGWVLTRGSMNNCLGRAAIASTVAGAKFSFKDFQWLCGISDNTPVAAYRTNETYISCLERKILVGEKDGNNLTACKEECR